ncbi:hypothetical protein VNO77_02034 [Canavalia gladiata]|uniref:Uncharacterized protein n=1 Tax=Canavalia gladiata TaxID=3824 RepID=A0AAN9R5J2_CANGL
MYARGSRPVESFIIQAVHKWCGGIECLELLPRGTSKDIGKQPYTNRIGPPQIAYLLAMHSALRTPTCDPRRKLWVSEGNASWGGAKPTPTLVPLKSCLLHVAFFVWPSITMRDPFVHGSTHAKSNILRLEDISGYANAGPVRGITARSGDFDFSLRLPLPTQISPSPKDLVARQAYSLRWVAKFKGNLGNMRGRAAPISTCTLAPHSEPYQHASSISMTNKKLVCRWAVNTLVEKAVILVKHEGHDIDIEQGIENTTYEFATSSGHTRYDLAQYILQNPGSQATQSIRWNRFF